MSVLGIILTIGTYKDALDDRIADEGNAAENAKIGLQKLTGNGRIFLAQEKGYFTAEGLNAELVYFPQPERPLVS